MKRVPRRELLCGVSAGSLIGGAGCLGGVEITCETFRTVLELHTRTVRIRLPVRYRREAWELAEQFAADGYVASAGDELAKGNADAVVVTVTGDVTRETASDRVEAAGVSDYDVYVRTVRESSFRTVSGGTKFPWERPLLRRRSDALRETAADLDVSLPTFRASQLRIGTDAVDDAVETIRALFRPGGRLTATLATTEGPLSDPPRFVSAVGDRRRIPPDGIRLESTADGVRLVATPEPADRYGRALFDPTWPGDRPPRADSIRVAFRLDGEDVLRRPLTPRERRYYEWFESNSTADPPDSVDPPRIVLPGLSAHDALRLAGALRAPTGTRNAFESICE